MKEHKMPKKDKPQLKPPSQASPIKGTAEPLALEDRIFNEYGDDLSDHDLSEAQKREFLLALWNIMTAFVDLGFRVGPSATGTGDQGHENTPDFTCDVLSYLHLGDMPHETVAPRSTDNEEEQS